MINENLDKVIAGGYCIGCGACAALLNSPLVIKMNPYGQLTATTGSDLPDGETCTNLASVCPFSEESPDEDKIAQALFGDLMPYDEYIGYYQGTYAGYVMEDKYRAKGSSGGTVSWLAVELMSSGLIDGVIHVKPLGSKSSRLFGYAISTNNEQIRQGAKSRYYPIEISEVMALVRELPGRYAFIGLPCFVKVARLLTQNDPLLKERIVFFIGLVCGHLKSAKFAEMLAWQCGIKPGDLVNIDFRLKLSKYPANKYGIRVQSESIDYSMTQPVDSLFGSSWGLGFFRYKACDYCDDVVAETADVTIGDAWLSPYIKDSAGTNLIIVRNSILSKLIKNAVQTSRLKLEELSVGDVYHTQAGGFRHRRDGLGYRLYLANSKHIWHPQKRVQPHSGEQSSRQWCQKQQLRAQMAEQSHLAFYEAVNQGDFDVFKRQMQPLLNAYLKIARPTVWERVSRILKKLKVR